jgi:Tfp pilus assembly protein PilO
MSKDLRNTLIAVALFVALAGVMVYFVTDTQDQLDKVTHDCAELETQIQQNNAYIARAPQLQRQLKELNDNFRDYVKILPSAEVATEQRMMRIVANYAESAQIQLDDLTNKTNLGKKGGGKLGEFEEVSVTFRIDADFESFVRFLDLLERHEQFIKVNAFSISPAPKPRVVDGKEIIDLSVQIDAYTYKYIPTKK